jgi:hypothetical protein
MRATYTLVEQLINEVMDTIIIVFTRAHFFPPPNNPNSGKPISAIVLGFSLRVYLPNTFNCWGKYDIMYSETMCYTMLDFSQQISVFVGLLPLICNFNFDVANLNRKLQF